MSVISLIKAATPAPTRNALKSLYYPCYRSFIRAWCRFLDFRERPDRGHPELGRFPPAYLRYRVSGTPSLETFLPGFPFWPSWSVYDSRLPAAMQRFSHCCQVRYSFRCRSGLRMLADHGVPAKPEGPLATPLPRRPSATRVRWLFRAVDVILRAQVAPKSAAACRRTTSGSDAPPQAATNNIARASRAVRPSSSADAASSSATSF